MVESKDHILVLKGIQELPFGAGKKLLIAFLQGDTEYPTIKNHNLDELEHFGSMCYDLDELEYILKELRYREFIDITGVKGKPWVKVYGLTKRGFAYLEKGSEEEVKTTKYPELIISDEDKKLFIGLSDLLCGYNDAQKKGIIGSSPHLLCIAGAGSGKTTVLTKRIEFLVKYKSVSQDKILAITFTRKGRHHMMSKLAKLGLTEVWVETFHSFCEKMLQKHNDLVYDRIVKVISYGEKIKVMHKALSSLNLTIPKAISIYFEPRQKSDKTPEQLANILMNDCFFVRDYFRFKHKSINRDHFNCTDKEHQKSADMIYGVCNYIEAYLLKHGLRDHADQLLDTLRLFQEHPEIIHKFSHTLVDEFQDVNGIQVKLIDILNSPNLFCVGDPRQSIYGWRGSDVNFILNFSDKYPDVEVIPMTRNYRSDDKIVKLINSCISRMQLPDLISNSKDKGEITIIDFNSENEELSHVADNIIKSGTPRHDVFVLARTNRLLKECSRVFTQKDIGHIVRTDDTMKVAPIANKGEVTLSTIHSIKGMEADDVYVIGCHKYNFPCKGSEHPVVEMIKVDEYDKFEEERRLLYVALSRARKKLMVTHDKVITDFISPSMEKLVTPTSTKLFKKVKSKASNFDSVLNTLTIWRNDLSRKQNIPAYMVLRNDTLEELAMVKPTTVKDLKSITGMGSVKIAKYGEDIIRMVN